MVVFFDRTYSTKIAEVWNAVEQTSWLNPEGTALWEPVIFHRAVIFYYLDPS